MKRNSVLLLLTDNVVVSCATKRRVVANYAVARSTSYVQVIRCDTTVARFIILEDVNQAQRMCTILNSITSRNYHTNVVKIVIVTHLIVWRSRNSVCMCVYPAIKRVRRNHNSHCGKPMSNCRKAYRLVEL